ncbi:MAG: MobC family plasmid mobilization relaxosome protein [Desulfovibrio sp.]
MKRVKTARSVAIMVRLHPEERDALRLNAGVHGLSMSDYIRQTCLGIRLRRTPEEKRRLRELARIGANLNQLAKWANTYKRSAEALEVLAALTAIERTITEWAQCKEAANETEERQ